MLLLVDDFMTIPAQLHHAALLHIGAELDKISERYLPIGMYSLITTTDRSTMNFVATTSQRPVRWIRLPPVCPEDITSSETFLRNLKVASSS